MPGFIKVCALKSFEKKYLKLCLCLFTTPVVITSITLGNDLSQNRRSWELLLIGFSASPK